VGGDLRDLKVWQKALALAARVIRVSRRFRGPGALVIADQLVRAAASIPANIAEGYGRGPGRDGARFFRIARGSAGELESHLHLARAGGWQSDEEAEALLASTREVRAMLSGLLRRVSPGTSS
jgi:four helix bundle protein